MTTREWDEADQDDADRVRAWQPRTALESLAGQAIEDSLHPAQDAQEPEPDPAPCHCPEHLINSDFEHDLTLEGDPDAMWGEIFDLRISCGKAADHLERVVAERDKARRDRDRFAETLKFRVKELDGARAEVVRVETSAKAAGIYAQTTTDLRYAAEATIDRVRTLAYKWAPFKDDGHTHWVGCHLVHADCFVYAIRAALAEATS